MENNLQVSKNVSDYAVSFYVIEKSRIALSELTYIGDLGRDYADLIKNKKDKEQFLSEFESVDKVYYFSRLNVPEQLRGKGLAKLLMKETIEFCRENNAMLINTVNPYGDMNLQQLNEFYQKCGMKLVNKQGLLIFSNNISNITNDISKKIKP